MTSALLPIEYSTITILDEGAYSMSGGESAPMTISPIEQLVVINNGNVNSYVPPAPYTRQIVQGDLSLEGKLIVAHGKQKLRPKLELWVLGGDRINPDAVTPVNLDTLVLDLQGYVPFVETFELIIE